MPVFEYSALDIKGKTVKGVLDAESLQVARQKLRATNIFPVAVTLVKESPGASKKIKYLSMALFDRVSPRQVALITRQLATLLGAGFPLVGALDTLLDQIDTHRLKKILTGIKDAIVEGSSFAAALGSYQATFPSFFVNMVRAGESSGTLELVLDQLAEITEKQLALSNRIRTAMVYPAIMTIVGAAALYFLLTTVVPSIVTIFSDMNQVLPAPTRVLIAASNFLAAYGWLFVPGAILIWLGLRAAKQTEKGRFFYDKIKLSLPLFGSFAKKLATARMTRTLGSLLKNGVTILAALEIVKNIAGNVLYAEKIETAVVDVSKGMGLGVSLAQGALVPSLAVQMIKVGEQSGDLEVMLDKIADVYENEAEASVMRLSALVEPLMILVMALAVGFIAISILLPIFEMNQLVR
jgi:general secretion pathway protein F